MFENIILKPKFVLENSTKHELPYEKMGQTGRLKS